MVLVDAGGVLLDEISTLSALQVVTDTYGVPLEDVHAFYLRELHLPTSRGHETEHWAFDRLREHYGPLDIAKMASAARTAPHLLPNVDEVLLRLSRMTRLRVLSNYVSPWLVGALENHDLLRYFEKLYISSDLGLRKPEPAIFERVLEDLDLPAESVIFVDDRIENLDAAKALGITPVLASGDAHIWGDIVEGLLTS